MVPAPKLVWQVKVGTVWDVAAGPGGVAVLAEMAENKPGFYLSVVNDQGALAGQEFLGQYDPVLPSPAPGRSWLIGWPSGAQAKVAMAGESGVYVVTSAGETAGPAPQVVPSGERVDALAGDGRGLLAFVHTGSDETVVPVGDLAQGQPRRSGVTFPEAVPLTFATPAGPPGQRASGGGGAFLAVILYRAAGESGPGSMAVVLRQDGKVLWQEELPGTYRAWYAAALHVTGDSLWARSDTVAAFSQNGRQVWEAPVAGSIRSVAAIPGGWAVASAYGWPSQDTLITTFDSNGGTAWATRLDGYPLGVYGVFAGANSTSGRGSPGAVAVAVTSEAAYGLDSSGRRQWEIHLPSGRVRWSAVVYDRVGPLLLMQGRGDVVYAYRFSQ